MMVYRHLIYLVVPMLLAACVGTHQLSNQVVVENPYVQRVQGMTHLGVVAMQKERWASAENAFKHALQASILANAPELIVQSWYNLAMVHKAMWQQGKIKVTKVQDDLTQVLRIASQHGLKNQAVAAQLQLQLLEIKTGHKPKPMPSLPHGLSYDVYLTAARVAQLQGEYTKAKQLYDKVLSMTKDDRTGLLLQAQAHMGLALLAKKEGNQKDVEIAAKKVLVICLRVGAPSISAHASMLLAGLASLPKQERIDYAQRALAIYHILHDANGERRAKALLDEWHVRE